MSRFMYTTWILLILVTVMKFFLALYFIIYMKGKQPHENPSWEPRPRHLWSVYGGNVHRG